MTGSVVETFDGGGGAGPVDANGHFDFLDECGFHIIGSISQTGHASGTWLGQTPCGCGTSSWYADREPTGARGVDGKTLDFFIPLFCVEGCRFACYAGKTFFIGTNFSGTLPAS